MSYFFSPHRGEVEWDIERFRDFVVEVETLESFLSFKSGIFGRKAAAADMVHRFLKFEQLDQDFAQMCFDVDIAPLTLPHRIKAGNRPSYQHCYDDDLIEWVAEKHALEMRLGQYQF